jgi:HlyD family secretion protein
VSRFGKASWQDANPAVSRLPHTGQQVIMRLAIKVIVGLVVLGIASWLGIPPLLAYWEARNKPTFRQATVSRGEITSVVNSTGTVQPVLNVQVGSFVSGPVQTVYVDFNDRVKKDQILAEVDPLLFKAQRNQAKAALDCAVANLLQAEAKLEQSKREWQRAEVLLPKKAIADTDYDLTKANYETAAANVAVCKATIEQNKASLELAQANLDYTKIRSPVDGIIVDRKIDSGQTVASQFQTPEMFKVAPEMDKRIYVFASVDEADIGLIRDAKDRQQPAMFTVDAYPNDLFRGKIHQVRLNPTTTQNVVTYTVVVESPNTDLKLLPGMTASLSFQIDKHERVVRVPNAALRYYPKTEHVRPEDRHLLEGEDQPTIEDPENRTHATEIQHSAAEKTEAARKRNRRYVWIVEGDLLKAVEIATGLNDSKNSEVTSGPLKEGQSVATGVAPPKS